LIQTHIRLYKLIISDCNAVLIYFTCNSIEPMLYYCLIFKTFELKTI